MRSLRAALVVTGTAILLTLVGCAPAAPATEASPTRTAIPSPTPTPTPASTPDATAPTAFVVTATEMSLIDSGGRIRSQVAFNGEDPAAFAADLGEAFGVSAEGITTPGGAEGAEFTTTYTWDSLTISSGFSPGQQCDARDCRGTFVYFTVAEFNGISLGTASGIQVGDSVLAARELGARPTPEIPLAAEPEDPSLFESSTDTTRVVLLDLNADETLIDRIRAGAWFYTHGNI
jgi:hypothetical protein